MTPDARDALLASLRQHEGLSLKPYRDTEGYLTIGCGRNLNTVGLREDEAEYLLVNDAAEAERSVLRVWPWVADLDDVRQAVVIELAFNMGLKTLRGFKKFWRQLEAGLYAAAEVELLRSDWAKQVGDRAPRLARRIRTGSLHE